MLKVASSYFNPRSPQGERLRRYVHLGLVLDISIHAPRKGSDGSFIRLTTEEACFNPRSPQGERRVVHPSHNRGGMFQSTLPARGATVDLFEVLRLVQFQSTLPARGATAKVHKNSCSNSHYCLKLSFFLPSPTSCCTPKPKVSTEDPSSIWCEPPGIFLSACGSRFLKESEALPADRRPCSQNAQSCFHSDCPGNKTAGCPSPGP